MALVSVRHCSNEKVAVLEIGNSGMELSTSTCLKALARWCKEHEADGPFVNSIHSTINDEGNLYLMADIGFLDLVDGSKNYGTKTYGRGKTNANH